LASDWVAEVACHGRVGGLGQAPVPRRDRRLHGAEMQTVFDWITVSIFIATAGIFFYRTQREWPPLYKYLGLSVGCAIANQLGNLGYAVPALLLIGLLVGALVWLGTRPYDVRQ
jgi:hypothetical protein